jgi:hypothetical protein
MQNALNSVSCYSNNTNEGNNPEYCLPLAPYVKTSNPDQSCLLANQVPNHEDLGYARNISHLPGCDNITNINTHSLAAIIAGSPVVATPYTGSYRPTSNSGSKAFRVLIKASNGNYVTAPSMNYYLNASIASASALSYSQVFLLQYANYYSSYAIMSEYNGMYVTAQQAAYPLIADKPSFSTWEEFNIIWPAGVSAPNATGVPVSLQSLSNNNYITLTGQTLWATSTVINAASTFTLIDADAATVTNCVW